MFDGLSCFYFDWETVGTWVGGIGSAAAACVAIWLAKSESRRRTNYSKFLFEKDLEKLQVIEYELRRSADAMHDLRVFGKDHPEFNSNCEKREEGFRELRKLASRLEYFGRSDRLFEYRHSRMDDFNELSAAVENLYLLPRMVDYWIEVSEEVYASDEMHAELNKFSKALEPFKASVS